MSPMPVTVTFPPPLPGADRLLGAWAPTRQFTVHAPAPQLLGLCECGHPSTAAQLLGATGSQSCTPHVELKWGRWFVSGAWPQARKIHQVSQVSPFSRLHVDGQPKFWWDPSLAKEGGGPWCGGVSSRRFRWSPDLSLCVPDTR